jgi:hypothetical protein
MRFISLVLIAIGLMLLGADVVTSLEKGHVVVRSLGQVWVSVNQHSLDAFKAWLEHTLPPPTPGWIESFIAHVYSWAPFGVLGVILAFLVGRRDGEA